MQTTVDKIINLHSILVIIDDFYLVLEVSISSLLLIKFLGLDAEFHDTFNDESYN